MEKALEILQELLEQSSRKKIIYSKYKHNKEFRQEVDAEIKKYSEAIAELEEAMKPKTCEWKQCDTEYDTHWDGSCGIGWMLEEGTPSYNGMKFCPQCGGKLIEIEPKDNA